jgi:tetratricopeptide (TPR) repeat protein
MRKSKIVPVFFVILTVLTGIEAAYGDPGRIAQSGTLTAAIGKAQVEIARPSASSSEKHDAYVLLGRLLHLSGDIEGAAEAWNAAAYAVEGSRDDTALLESAACYLAMGEWEKAEACVKVVLISVRSDKNVFLKARYLTAQIEAFRNGDNVILNSLADDPEYSSSRPALYWTLWKLSGKPEYKAKLITEYPESVETRMLIAENSGSRMVMEASSPQWLLPPGEGRDIITLEKITASPSKVPAGALETGIPPALQTGIFNRRENAAAQASRLKSAGFKAEVSRRLAGESEYWAVTVPSGPNMNKTLILLKEAGFDGFPVY